MAETSKKFEYTLISDLEKKFGLFIKPKEFHLLFPEIRNYRSVARKYWNIKKCIGKADHQDLTIQEAAEWLGISPEKIYQIVHL